MIVLKNKFQLFKSVQFILKWPNCLYFSKWLTNYINGFSGIPHTEQAIGNCGENTC